MPIIKRVLIEKVKECFYLSRISSFSLEGWPSSSPGFAPGEKRQKTKDKRHKSQV
jgi:hypothetical protein